MEHFRKEGIGVGACEFKSKFVSRFGQDILVDVFGVVKEDGVIVHECFLVLKLCGELLRYASRLYDEVNLFRDESAAADGAGVVVVLRNINQSVVHVNITLWTFVVRFLLALALAFISFCTFKLVGSNLTKEFLIDDEQIEQNE